MSGDTLQQNQNTEELRQILQENKALLTRVRETEEELQDLIARGQARDIQDMEIKREKLQREVNDLEERRQKIVPAGSGVRSYIQEHVAEEELADFITLLEEIGGLIYQIQNHQEVNRSLLHERIRFSREVQELFMPTAKTYDPSGQVNYRDGNQNFNIDRSC